MTTTRRTLLSTLGGGLFTIGIASVLGKGAPPAGAAKSSTPSKAQAWMDEAIATATREPVGALYLGRFADPMYFLTQPIAWKPGAGQSQYATVNVPAGFVSDLASIPRVFWSLLRPDGNYAYAAILHDYLYWTQTRSRPDSDMILKLGMEDFSVDSRVVSTIYEAVRVGGGAAWKDNARLKSSGEKRILKRYPEDPRTTWSQ